MTEVYERRLKAFAAHAWNTHASFDPSQHVFRQDGFGAVHVSATLCAFLAGWYETQRIARHVHVQPRELHFPYVKFTKDAKMEIGLHLLKVDGDNGDAFFQPVSSIPANMYYDKQETPVLLNSASITNTPPTAEYQATIRKRIASHLARRTSVDLIRRTEEGICFSPSLCAAIRGLYDPDDVRTQPHVLDHRLFPMFMPEHGIGVSFLSVSDKDGGLVNTPLLSTFVR
jgi:hypothetical protein